LDELNQRAVGERVLAEHLRRVADVGVVAPEHDFDLRRVLDDVVVREDEAVLADDEPGAGRPRRLLARRFARAALAAAAGRCLLSYVSRTISVCTGPVTVASPVPTTMLISVRTPKSSK